MEAAAVDNVQKTREEQEQIIGRFIADQLECQIGFLKRFVYLQHNSHYLLIVLWSMTTYLVDQFDETGYLMVYSPEKQSGKTRLLELLDSQVYCISDILIGTLTELTAMCGKHPECSDTVQWEIQGEVKAFLDRYKFDQKSVRLSGGEPRRRYVLPLAKLQDLIKRYVGETVVTDGVQVTSNLTTDLSDSDSIH